MTTTPGRPAGSGTGRLIALWMLSGLVALTFIGAGSAKLAGAAVMVDSHRPWPLFFLRVQPG